MVERGIAKTVSATEAGRVEIKTLVLALNRPRRVELVLNAAASNPAVCVSSKLPRANQTSAISKATRAVNESAINGVADTTANGAELVPSRTQTMWRRIAAPWKSASRRRTPNCRAGRCSRSDRHRNRHLGSRTSLHAGSILAVATVDTDVQAAPVHAHIGNVLVATRGRLVHVGCVSGCGQRERRSRR